MIPEEKAAMIRQQANAKILWGARDREVLEWLEERHGITGDAAVEMLAEAHPAKRGAVRSKALWYLVLSIPGMLVTVAFVVAQRMGHFIIIGYGSLLVIGLGFVSLGVFVRSLFRLLTGRTPAAVD
jgi:hypothetical protein